MSGLWCSPMTRDPLLGVITIASVLQMTPTTRNVITTMNKIKLNQSLSHQMALELGDDDLAVALTHRRLLVNSISVSKHTWIHFLCICPWGMTGWISCVCVSNQVDPPIHSHWLWHCQSRDYVIVMWLYIVRRTILWKLTLSLSCMFAQRTFIRQLLDQPDRR